MSFEAIAASFNRDRALPPEALPAIRTAVWAALGARTGGRLLDLGAGSGRIGQAFVAAGDAYIGLDLSPAMLTQFTVQTKPAAGRLAQANGESLPFANATFEVVFLAQVLSQARAWRRLLAEARRVLQAGGLLILGQTVEPSNGIEVQLRARLALILADMQVVAPAAGLRRQEARAWLQAEAKQHRRIVAARWNSTRSPGRFLTRHATGVRFAALPTSIKEAALQQLSAWVISTFGSIEVAFIEPYAFELDMFTF